MDELEQGDMKVQVQNRLDVLFDEGQSVPEDQADQMDFSESPLKTLKAILLALDWEITEETLNSLLRETKSLEELYREEKVPFTLLQILTAIGKYIRLNKGKAHPNTIKLINSVYLALEKTAASEGMVQQEKERFLLNEVAKFKKLKEDIAILKEKRGEERLDDLVTPPITEPKSPAGEVKKKSAQGDESQMAPHEAFAIAVEEIKDLIRAEFKALRAEIGLWRNSK
jgi:hypothetical protein